MPIQMCVILQITVFQFKLCLLVFKTNLDVPYFDKLIIRHPKHSHNLRLFGIFSILIIFI